MLRGTLDADALVVAEVTTKLVTGRPAVSAEIVLVNTSSGRSLATAHISVWPGSKVQEAAIAFYKAIESEAATLLFKEGTGDAETQEEEGGILEYVGEDGVPQG